ncbi:MAG: hypothetical protein M0040_07590 [Actinomycetota bacterium]|nr:hypothetical protein [Actinomycetota bacterium]
MYSGEVWRDPITCGLPASQSNVVAVRFTQATSSLPRCEEHWRGANPEYFPTRLSVSEGAPRRGDHAAAAEYAAVCRALVGRSMGRA